MFLFLQEALLSNFVLCFCFYRLRISNFVDCMDLDWIFMVRITACVSIYPP